MKTRLFGKKIENIYDVDYKWKEVKDTNGETKTVYTDKPNITKESKVKEWVELCSYEGEPRYNSEKTFYFSHTVNISENERVVIEEEIFRADLNEVHMYTDKIVKTIDTKKEEAFAVCETQIKAFNKMMIESNNKLMSYCDLHKLSYEDTDCIELFKLVFPHEEYVIEDGVMKVKERVKATTYTLGKIDGLAISSAPYKLYDCVTTCASNGTISKAVSNEC